MLRYWMYDALRITAVFRKRAVFAVIILMDCLCCLYCARAADLPNFYLDLQDENFQSPFAIYHRRFSTNTVPKWFLAQVAFRNCNKFEMCVLHSFRVFSQCVCLHTTGKSTRCWATSIGWRAGGCTSPFVAIHTPSFSCGVVWGCSYYSTLTVSWRRGVINPHMRNHVCGKRLIVLCPYLLSLSS